MKKDGMFKGSLKKVGDKLVYIKTGDQEKYKEFVREVEAGAHIDIFMEINSADGTLAQLAKVHKCIRVIAAQTGNTFDDIKIVIKDMSGLVVKRTVMDKEYMDWKSFGNCSRDDLNLAIQACIDLGDQFTLNLR
jgi:hypothetical protein